MQLNVSFLCLESVRGIELFAGEGEGRKSDPKLTLGSFVSKTQSKRRGVQG